VALPYQQHDKHPAAVGLPGGSRSIRQDVSDYFGDRDRLPVRHVHQFPGCGRHQQYGKIP